MDLDGLAVFCAVARHGGITKAARALNTVQSNVTARVRQLEHELGVELFERHSRGVSLTAAGRRLQDYAGRIAHLVDDARRAVTDDLAVGATLNVGTLETTAAVRMPPVLVAFAEACPQVDLSLATGTSGELIDRVLEREIEGAFVCGPVRHPALIETQVFAEELVLVTRAGMDLRSALAATGGTKPKAIVFRAGCSYRQRLESILVRRGLPDPRWMEFGTLDGIIGCIAAGMGITLLPRAAVARSSRIALHTLPPAEASVSTVFITRRDGYRSGALERFVECALKVAGKERSPTRRRAA